MKTLKKEEGETKKEVVKYMKEKKEDDHQKKLKKLLS